MVRGVMVKDALEAIVSYSPSPRRREGRVRGSRQTGIVCESPRDYARGLRRRQTDAERRVWARLRHRRLQGAKFARQVPIRAYAADFCCRELKVIVELDGGQHAVQARSDTERTVFLEALGCPSPRPSPQRGEGEGWE